MNYLQLVNSLRDEIAATGADATTLQFGLAQDTRRLARFVRDAWEEIQSKRTDWLFLRVSSSHTIPQYASLIEPTEYLAGNVLSWEIGSLRMAEAGESRAQSQPLEFVPYDDFVNGIGLNTGSYKRPTSYTIRAADNAILIGPAADAEYELYYDYIMMPQILSADDDEPVLPRHLHKVIVYRAMMSFGRHIGSPEIYQDGERKYASFMAMLENQQLPPITFGSFVS